MELSGARQIVWIESIKLENYRSVGAPGVELLPVRGLNTIVGPNNVGKSSLFAAAQPIWNGNGLGIEDCHWRIPSRPAMTQVRFRLSMNEVDSIFDQLIGRIQINGHRDEVLKFKNWLINASILIQSEQNNIFIGGYLARGQGLLTGGEGDNVKFLTFIERLGTDDVESKFRTVQRIDFENDWLSVIRSIVLPKFKIFSDVRTRPQGIGGDRGSQVKESLEGGSTTDFLVNLMTGEPVERARFQSIKEHFERFFPGWNFQLVGAQGSAQRLVFNREGFEVDIPQENAGTGLVEVLTIIANLEGKTESVLVIEEPELHLHPQSQRALHNLILESSNHNQLFVVTHSPFFVDPNYLIGLWRMWMPGNEARLSRFPADIEEVHLAILKESFRGLRQRELLSSRAALLVEGETEEAFLQAIGTRIGLDTDVYGVSIVSVGGQDGYMPYLRLVTEMQIPFLCHRDLRKGIRKKYKDFEKRFRVIGAEFEEYLKQEGLEGVYQEAVKKFGKDRKVAIGRYLGNNMDPDQVPKKFVDLLDEIIEVAKKG